MTRCCFCDDTIEPDKDPKTGFVYWEGGNNPYPLKPQDQGLVCCDPCNINLVLPARLNLYESAKTRDTKKKGGKW